MKKNKKIKYYDYDKKQKMLKAVIFAIVSFCTVCCFALSWVCGLILALLGVLLLYVASRPVKMPDFNDLLAKVGEISQNEKNL